MSGTAQVEGGGRRRPLALVAGALAAVLYSNFLLDWALRGGSGMDLVISTLAADGEPNAALLRATDVACAVLVLLLVPLVRAALPARRARTFVAVGLVVFAAGIVAAAAVHACAPGSACTGAAASEARWHDLTSLVSEAGVIASLAGTWVLTRRDGPRWLHRWASIVIAVVLTVWVTSAAVAAVQGTATPAIAYLQRFQVLATSSWILALGVLASRTPRTPDPAQSQH